MSKNERTEVRFTRAILTLSRNVSAMTDQRSRSHEVTPQQTELLRHVLERGSHVTSSSLATLLQVDSSTISRTLSGLESLRLISRQKSDSDKRECVVRVTPQGRKVLSTVYRDTGKILDLLFGKVPKDRQLHTVEVLEALIRII